MANELPERVANILRSEHRPDASEMRGLDATESTELRNIAGGSAHPEYRVKALTVLATTGQASAGELLAQALRDTSADATVRAAGATWLSRIGAPDAEAALLSAAATETTPIVQHKVIAGIARVGAETSLAALEPLTGQPDEALREHATFARSIVAHRLGRTGYEVPAVEPADLLPADIKGGSTPALEAQGPDDAAHVLAQIENDRYGMPADELSVSWLTCPGQQFALVVNSELRDTPEVILQRPMIAALVALRSPADGSYHTSLIVLSSPQGGARVTVSANRPTGRTMYYGVGEVEDGTVRVRLDAVSAPGATETTATAVLVAGTLAELDVSRGTTLEARHPTPVEEPAPG
jgi:hypothetical protein